MRKLMCASMLLLPAVGFAQAPGAAQPFDYNIAELRLLDTDNDGDGLELRGSYALDENWFVLGAWREVDFGPVDGRQLELGAGYAWQYRPGLDLIGAVKYIDVDVDGPFVSGDDNGLGLSAGFRHWLSPIIEWRGAVHHQRLDDSDTYLELAGDYYLNDRISVGLSLEFAGDLDVLSIGGRWFFR